MGIVSKCWFRDEVLHTFSTQLPNNLMQNIAFVTNATDLDKLTDEMKLSNAENQLQVTNIDGLATLKEKSQDLVVIYNLTSNENTDVEKLLDASLRVLQADGSAIVCEFLDSLSAKSIANLSTLFDSFESESVGKSFKVYCMNQFEDSKHDKIGFYWILQSYSGKNEILLDDNDEKMTRSFLDKTQYTNESIEAYEWIFGHDFISPGGVEENRKVLSYFDGLGKGKRMLDIGCGIGGSPRQVSKEFQMEVLGCDISANMLAIAIGRSKELNDRRVKHQLADAVEYNYEPNSFDFAFSRDCVQHIDELQRLFQNVYNCLKPGGQFLVTMYGKGEGQLTNEFLQYVKDRKYTLRSLKEVLQIAKNAGFDEVQGENITKRFEEILHNERQKAVDNRDAFMERFPAKKYDSLLEGWEQKLRFIAADNHNWLKIKCIKK